jgi:glycosyltransferase involved in cell wall biosynthesis
MADSFSILLVTSEWPVYAGDISGIHVLQQAQSLRRAGATVDVFHFRGNKNPLVYWQAIREFRRRDLEPYDVIHAHHGQAGFVALSQRRKPVVITFHGSDLLGIRDRAGKVTFLGYILRFMSRWVAWRADAVIVVAAHLAKYIPKRPYHVIPMGVDLELFRPFSLKQAREALVLPMDTSLILFVGNPDRTEKRYWLAVKAVENLREDFSTQLIVANGIAPDKMPLYMNACDVMLVTSSSEGSPAAVREALACNLPIVSVDVGDIRQQLQNVKNCIVCEAEDPTSIGLAMKNILVRHERTDGKNAVQGLDSETLMRKVIAVYSDLLRDKQ